VEITEILARVDAGEAVTSQELGYLLPELARRKVTVANHIQRCCTLIFSCTYEYRGGWYLWLCGHAGQTQSGIARIPAVAIHLTHDRFTSSMAGLTRCRRCGRGKMLILDPPNIVRVKQLGAPTFGEVIE
jgi:hypothetical protein